ncbi:MAG: FxsA family protein [Pseudomonadota bacterium]
MRTRPPLWPLVALIPLAEIFLLGRVEMRLGAMPLLVLVCSTGALGVWLMRRAGKPQLQTLIRMEPALDPAVLAQRWEAALLFLAGALLILPGPLSDLAGFTLLLPGNRKRLAGWLSKRIGGFMPGSGTSTAGGRTLEGEVVRKTRGQPKP